MPKDIKDVPAQKPLDEFAELGEPVLVTTPVTEPASDDLIAVDESDRIDIYATITDGAITAGGAGDGVTFRNGTANVPRVIGEYLAAAIPSMVSLIPWHKDKVEKTEYVPENGPDTVVYKVDPALESAVVTADVIDWQGNRVENKERRTAARDQAIRDQEASEE